jgi:hypothetical protein
MGPDTGRTISADPDENEPERASNRWFHLDPDNTKGRRDMSFQAYLDNIEARTGKTPAEFVAMAKANGFAAPGTKAGVIVDWLKDDFGLGRGHAMALVHVIRNGAQIGGKHVGSGGTHSDPSDTLVLTGKDV